MLAQLKERQEKHLVRSARHPTAPLTIWNYTEKCQYDKAWDVYTMSARGLILDDAGNVVARGFNKFFNYGEHPGDLPTTPFKVYDKKDGSLGILYFIDGEPCIATRGSFTGPQTIHATKVFRERYRSYRPPDGTTAVFEVVYPENRIVVNYGDEDDLTHLGLVCNATGRALWLDIEWPGHRVEEFEPMPPEELLKQVRPNAEGFVLRWPCGTQVKIKLEDYLRIHRAMYCTSTRSIWELLAKGGDIYQLIADMPDELHPFVKEHGVGLLDKFKKLEDRAKDAYLWAWPEAQKSRKAFAAAALKFQHPPILFAMLDNKPYAPIIWKYLEPEWIPAKAPPAEEAA